MAQRRTSLKNQQKRGCATVPVAREDALVNGRVPKGCRFHPERGNGTVLCIPSVAEKMGVLDVKRRKPLPKKGQLAKRFCYVENSPYPRQRNGNLKPGCEEDEETGEICCDKSHFKPKAKAKAKTSRKRTTKKAAPKKRASRSAKKTAARKPAAKKTSRKTASKRKTSRRGRGQQQLFGVEGEGEQWLDSALEGEGEEWLDSALEGEDLDALEQSGVFDLDLDDDELLGEPLEFHAALADAGAAATVAAFERAVTAQSHQLALLDDGDDALSLLGEDLMLPAGDPPRVPKAYLGEFEDYAKAALFGALAIGGGLAATYEIVDRMAYFDDKPMARAGTFIGVGAAGAGLAWWLSQDSSNATEWRSLGAGFAAAFFGVGTLGLIRTMLEKKASETEDPEQRKLYEDRAEHIFWAEPHHHSDASAGDDSGDTTDSGATGGADGEVSTTSDGGSSTTAGVPYPFNSFSR